MKLKNIVLHGILLCIAYNAQAMLHMEITGGQASGLPIVIAPFALESAAKSSEVEDLAKIIKADLENSGQFKAIPFEELRQFSSQPTAMSYQAWKALGVEDLIIGRVRKTGGGRFVVNFELLDVIRHNPQGTPALPLLAMQFDNIRAQDFRALGHHISDLVFEKLIGVKGFFSTRIAYITVMEGSKDKFYTLEVADYDGVNPKPLFRSTYNLMSPAWSPDGKKIAFVSFEKERAGINVVDVLTGRVTRITQFPGLNQAPAWSPDNRTLALVLSKDGSPKIYTLDLDSKQLTRITDGSSMDTEPRFTPDGRAIVFTSNRGGKPQVYRVILNSGKIERLTFKGDYNTTPSITPDGKRLVTLHKIENGLFGIAVHNLQNGELKILTQGSLIDCPSIAPNGMMVLYGSHEGSQGALGAVSLDGRFRVRLPLREGNVQAPAWSSFVPS